MEVSIKTGSIVEIAVVNKLFTQHVLLKKICTAHEIDKKKNTSRTLSRSHIISIFSLALDNYFPTFSLVCQFVQTISIINRKCQGPLIDEDVNINLSG